MKPSLYKVPVQHQNSFNISHTIQPNFGTVWHYHPELELHYVIKGEGIRFIGDDISTFSPGELILLGQNLPHTWRCHEEYFRKGSAKQAEAIVLQFLPDCLGESFLNLPEARMISRLFDKANTGLLIKGKQHNQLVELLFRAIGTSGLNRLVVLLEILELLAENDDYEVIASSNAFYGSGDEDNRRLDRIYNHILSNYQRRISLDEIASLCNFSPNYFCRYFKQMTGKTFHDFLVEVRISHVCRLLAEGDMPIQKICYECGFNDITSFFRYFKKLKGITPAEYKRKFIG